MKVGLYNRWLPTLGGGEKYSLSVAEHLSRNHQVMVLSHEEVSKDLAAERLKLDLSGVDFCVIPDYSNEELERVSGGFDLFFNASFMCYFPARAPQNIYLVYFPSPLRRDYSQRLRRRMGFSLKRFFMLPTFENSLFQIRPQGATCLLKTDVNTTLYLPGSRIPYSIKFGLSAGHPGLGEVSFFLDDQPVHSVVMAQSGRFVPVQFPVPAGPKTTSLRLVMEAQTPSDPRGLPLRHLLLANLELSHPHFRFFSKFISKGVPGLLPRLYSMKPQPDSFARFIETYHQVWAISQFTRKWVRTYWNRDSEILYPPVAVKDFSPGTKRNRILNVGRFFAGGHNKKHPEMISAFKTMIREGLEGWELHLAGGTNPQPEHQAYLKKIFRQAQGYPIIIHPDISFSELTRLYGHSALYWHASGYGEKEDRVPHKFEHFGITTVEAMAAGCVPVVIGKGGQPEIVRHGENGFLWQTLGELKKRSWELIRDDALRRCLSRRAIADSRHFDRVQFNATLDRLLLGRKSNGDSSGNP